MALESVFETFFTVQTLILCLGAYIVTYIVRTVVENYWLKSSESNFWNHLFLPLGPIINGGVLALLTKSLAPAVLNGSMAGVVTFGMICGSFSALLYSRIKDYLNNAAK